MTSGTCCLPQWCVESWALVQQRRLCLEVALDKVYWFYIIYFYKKNTDRLFSCLLIDWDFTVVKGLRKGNKCIKLDQPKLERRSLLSFVMQPMRKAEGHEMWAARTKEKKIKKMGWLQSRPENNPWHRAPNDFTPGTNVCVYFLHGTEWKGLTVEQNHISQTFQRSNSSL